MGTDSPKGLDFADRWRYPSFRRAFRVITAVWGLAFLAESLAQAVIIETASTATAKTTSNVMPQVVAALVVAWNVWYGKRRKREGELAAAAGRSD